LESLRLLSLESTWRAWLRENHPDQNWDNEPLPQRAVHADIFNTRKNEWRREFAIRNYRAVFEHLRLHGRGVWNTVVYCFWAVLGALVVNPLAAYALSRFKLRGGTKVMLFCLCTMAFPPMVTQIPGLLMMRHLGMLNTFYALLLPGLANGYSIFLLKGFFDSQPRELYEAAALDGAGEWRIFWGIAMNLSRPILAVVGLNAFTLAYSNFMFAFVVCQDRRMWTLMVWLYQLQQNAGQAVMYASLVTAALPTLCVFLFCQRLILRGIVVPVEK
jgi:multiple sugar transport system permease protein